jgi:predicted nucleotidyltransferase
LEKIKPALTGFLNEKNEEIPKNVIQVILFGSYAKGTPRVGSDIDIAIVSQESWSFEDRSAVRHLFDDFDCGDKLSFFFTTENGLESNDINNANFWIRTEGVTLWNRN